MADITILRGLFFVHSQSLLHLSVSDKARFLTRSINIFNIFINLSKLLRNVFRNGLPVYMSFSGGKDSLALAQVVLGMLQRGEIRPEQLSVHFIDEEAIFPCVEKIVEDWRRKFLMLGVEFQWFCVEVKHFNCFNELSEDETFICWDKTKKAVWVRQPPNFAIRSHPLLHPRKDAYQDWLPRMCMDGITMIGVRVAESVQRLKNIARMTASGHAINTNRQIYPIYDWTNNDVWRYLYEQRVEIPEIYLYLWQAGVGKSQLRVSQFFSVDTAKSLVQMNEYYPDLMERITRREPNAYLAALYWDSDMFGRRTRTRRVNEGEAAVDYRALLIAMFNDMEGNFTTPHKLKIAQKYRNFFLRIGAIAEPKDFKAIYDGLIRGDPKLRSYRALYQQIYGRYVNAAKKSAEGAVTL